MQGLIYKPRGFVHFFSDLPAVWRNSYAASKWDLQNVISTVAFILVGWLYCRTLPHHQTLQGSTRRGHKSAAHRTLRKSNCANLTTKLLPVVATSSSPYAGDALHRPDEFRRRHFRCAARPGFFEENAGSRAGPCSSCDGFLYPLGGATSCGGDNGRARQIARFVPDAVTSLPGTNAMVIGGCADGATKAMPNFQ